MSSGWGVYISFFVALYFAGSIWLLVWQRKRRVEPGESIGHEFDGIVELDNPMPMWWLGTFVGSLIWGIGYLIAYPGMGNFAGALGWTQVGQYEAEMADAEAKYGPIYDKYAAMPIVDVAKDEAAVGMGARIFANNCATCHGSDARGSLGFPNLTDDDWKWGGDPADIKKTIIDGRTGMMPPFAPAVGEENIGAVVAYVKSLSGTKGDPSLIATGEAKFKQVCIACHGIDGTGNKLLGAPNLTDDIWLYGDNDEAIADGLHNGRTGMMPAHGEILGERRAHIVAAYVYSLSR